VYIYKNSKEDITVCLLLSFYTIINAQQNTICADEEKNKAYVWKLNGLLDYSV